MLNYLSRFSTFLLLISIFWLPWAFGCVHYVPKLVFSILCYLNGICVLVLMSCKFTKEQFYYKFNKNFWIYLPLVALIAYSFIGFINNSASWNENYKYLYDFRGKVAYLPSSIAPILTLNSINTFGLMLSSVIIFQCYINNYRIESPRRVVHMQLSFLVNFLILSTVVLAIVSIIQRIDGTPNLLWFYDRERFGAGYQSFGPFGYRSNGAQYINLVLPLCYERLSSLRNNGLRSQNDKTIPYIFSIIILSISVLISYSRAGIVLNLITNISCIWIYDKYFYRSKKLIVSTILISILCVFAFKNQLNIIFLRFTDITITRLIKPTKLSGVSINLEFISW